MYVNSTAILAELCVYLLTWNVATKNPQKVDMKDMLSLNYQTSCPNGQLPDIYVLGFQEVKVLKRNLGGYFTNEENEWTLEAQKYLSNRNYYKVAAEKMHGLLINIWAQRQHIPNIKSVETSNTATGIGNVLGNKGAVSVRMFLYEVPTSFVIAHLAAHDEKLQNRINDYNAIASRHSYRNRNYNSIFKHDVVFWAGDLNFRLNGRQSAQEISNKIQRSQYADLLVHDQLRAVKQSYQAFTDLQEGPIRFPPTFKFHPGTSEYNLKRRPAWCDRILYRAINLLPGIQLNLQQLSYKSHPQYTISDHKPVSAEFLLTIGVNRNLPRAMYYT